MKRILSSLMLCGVLIAGTSVAGEIGLKLGSAKMSWSDGTSDSLDGYAAVYGGSFFPVSPMVKVGPSFEIGYGKKELAKATCWSYTDCTLDLTYTALELNAKAVVTLTPIVSVFGGAGLSYNRFGLDIRDSSGNLIATYGDETGSGLQVFGGVQLNITVFSVGLEYKYKKVNTDSVDKVDYITLNLALSF